MFELVRFTKNDFWVCSMSKLVNLAMDCTMFDVTLFEASFS